MHNRLLLLGLAASVAVACSETETGGPLLLLGGAGQGAGSSVGGSGAVDGAGGGFSSGSASGGSSAVEQYSELWYSVDQLLVLVSIHSSDGSVLSVQSSTLVGSFDVGQNGLTMLDDGSLLGMRLSQVDDQTHFYYIADPPRDGSDVTPVALGVMPDGIMLEALYTDCEGRVYGMDTGVDDVSSEGNRLLRFTGDVTAGNFDFVVVSDLATADVADIDDMSPGISANQITDNPGLAIDTGTIHAFDYQTGSGTMVASGGTYGMHALGGALFADGLSRLYVLSVAAELFEVDPQSFALSGVLVTGPTPANGNAGWSGLAGPLTDCETGFTPPQ